MTWNQLHYLLVLLWSPDILWRHTGSINYLLGAGFVSGWTRRRCALQATIMGTAVFWKPCNSSVSTVGLRQRSTSTAGRDVNVLLRNVGYHLSGYTVSQPRKWRKIEHVLYKGILQALQRLGQGLDGPWFEFVMGKKFFCSAEGPDGFWGPPSLLFNG